MSKEQSEKERIIETVKEQVCDRLCRYPRETDAETWEMVQEEICGRCPLDLLDILKED